MDLNDALAAAPRHVRIAVTADVLLGQDAHGALDWANLGFVVYRRGDAAAASAFADAVEALRSANERRRMIGAFGLGGNDDVVFALHLQRELIRRFPLNPSLRLAPLTVNRLAARLVNLPMEELATVDSRVTLFAIERLRQRPGQDPGWAHEFSSKVLASYMQHEIQLVRARSLLMEAVWSDC